MKTVIMAGGKGTRISTLFPDIPKPLIPIKDENGVEKPVLEWEIESLRSQGFTDIILTVSHMHEKIEAYFGDGSRLGVSIEYFVEDTSLGNAGALFLLRQKLGNESFLLLNADAVFDIDFNRFTQFHKEHGGLVTLFTHPNSHPYDSGLIIAATDGKVEGWLAKEDERPQWYKNRVNAGLHVINPAVLDMSGIDADTIGLPDKNGKPRRVDLDRQILKPLCGTGRMFCYDSPEYCKDMGTPERFYSVQHNFESGVVQQKNLNNRQKAIFLDRDGTINKYVGFLRNIEKFELLPGVAEAIKRINASGYLCIVITNQPVIARGEVTIPELDLIHNKMETLLGAEGAYIDGLYYCPHHPDKGFKGEVAELKFDCDCRKPKPGLILQASKDFNISLENSWMIGDGENDVKAGQAAGCHTLRIITENNKNIQDNQEVKPTAFVDDLLRAVKLIEVLDKLDSETIDPQAQYVLFNRSIQQALWLFKKYADGNKSQNEEMFVGDLTSAVTLLIHQDDSDDFDLLTLDQYLKVQGALMELHVKCEQEIAANSKEVPIEQIEYKDFILIDIIPGLTTRTIKFTTYLEWFMRDDFKAFKDRLFTGLNLKNEPKRNPDDNIGGILATTEKEFDRKVRNKNYYESNCAVIMYVVRYIFTEELLEVLKTMDKDENTRFLVMNYQSIFHDILLNVEDLCSLYSLMMSKKSDGENPQKDQHLSSIRSRFISTVSVHQVLRQELYGSASFHAFADKELSASIGTIRQLIELRIRRSFGILSLKDDAGNIVPLDMSRLFEIIGKHKNEIVFPIKLENIIRIYRWSNNYVHSGLGDYPWIPLYLERMLVNFSFGNKEKDGSWNVNNGIKMKQEILDTIGQELLDAANTDRDGNQSEKYSLYKCKPECMLLS